MIFIMTIGILPLIIINRLMIGDYLKLVAKDNGKILFVGEFSPRYFRCL